MPTKQLWWHVVSLNGDPQATLTCHPGTPPAGGDLWQSRSDGSENENDECEEAHHPNSWKEGGKEEGGKEGRLVVRRFAAESWHSSFVRASKRRAGSTVCSASDFSLVDGLCLTASNKLSFLPCCFYLLGVTNVFPSSRLLVNRPWHPPLKTNCFNWFKVFKICFVFG